MPLPLGFVNLVYAENIFCAAQWSMTPWLIPDRCQVVCKQTAVNWTRPTANQLTHVSTTRPGLYIDLVSVTWESALRPPFHQVLCSVSRLRQRGTASRVRWSRGTAPSPPRMKSGSTSVSWESARWGSAPPSFMTSHSARNDLLVHVSLHLYLTTWKPIESKENLSSELQLTRPRSPDGLNVPVSVLAC